MREIITDIELLSVPCEPLEFITETGIDKTLGDEIISELHAVMEADPKLVALAAPQIGYQYRIFCIRFNDGIKTFINPIIKKKLNGLVLTAETCASIPEKEFLLTRPREVEIIYYTDKYKYEDNKLLDPVAGVFDQQAQLLDGILPSDLGIPYDYDPASSVASMLQKLSEIISCDTAEPEDKAEAEQLYLNLIDLYKQFNDKRLAEYTKGLEDTEKATYNKLRFTEDVINGRAQVVTDPVSSSNLNREQRRAIQFNQGPKRTKKVTAAEKLAALKQSSIK